MDGSTKTRGVYVKRVQCCYSARKQYSMSLKWEELVDKARSTRNVCSEKQTREEKIALAVAILRSPEKLKALRENNIANEQKPSQVDKMAVAVSERSQEDLQIAFAATNCSKK